MLALSLICSSSLIVSSGDVVGFVIDLCTIQSSFYDSGPYLTLCVISVWCGVLQKKFLFIKVITKYMDKWKQAINKCTLSQGQPRSFNVKIRKLNILIHEFHIWK